MRGLIFAALLCLIASPAWAEKETVHPQTYTKTVLEGVTIDSIVIDNRNIFDTTQSSYSNFLFKWANRLHVTTKKWVIKDELLLKEGQPYSTELAEESARNMRERLALYDVWIEPELLSNGNALVRVVTVDQWSLTGGADFMHEARQTTWNVGAEENNLLGTGQYVSLNYYNRSVDGNYVDGSYLNRRLLGHPIRLNLDFSTDPMNKLRSIHFGHPFYDLAQRISYDFGLATVGGRRDVYNDAAKIATSERGGDFTTAAASYRFGDYHRKLEFGFDYLYRFETTTDKRILSTDPSDSLLALAAFPVDSLYHQAEMTSNLSIFRYVRLRYIDGIGYTEDFSSGHFLSASYARAFKPDFRDNVFDLAGYRYTRNFAVSDRLLLFNYGQIYWIKAGQTIRHLTSIEAKYYDRLYRAVTLASRVAYDSDFDEAHSHTLILGGASGIRGFPKYFLSGDRRLVVNLEARIHSDWEILSMIPGGVIFADLGNIWQPGDPVRMRGFHHSMGLGLRFGFVNSSRNIVRIDLSYTDEAVWDLTVGTKQYFEAHF